jgi:hypothetical protein
MYVITYKGKNVAVADSKREAFNWLFNCGIETFGGKAYLRDFAIVPR